MPVLAEPARARAVDHRLRGIGLRIVAVCGFALMALAIKLAAEDGVNTIEAIFYRNLFSVPLLLAWIALGPGFRSLGTRRPRAHATRATIGIISMLLNFQAVIMLPLAESTTIGFSAPLFATILSAVLLGEAVGRRRWTAVALGFVGVLIVMRPGGGGAHIPPLGLGVALLSAVGVASVVVTVRQLGATEPATTTVFWFNCAALAVSGLAMPLFGSWHAAATWPWLVMIGVFGGIAQIAMTASLRYAPISVLAPFDYLQLVWATALAWLVWAIAPTPSTLAGGALIAGSGVWTAWREHRLHREQVAATPPEI